MTPEWHAAACRAYPDQTPFVIAVSTAGRMLGLLPLVRQGAGRGARLRFGGYNLGDRFEPPAVPGAEAEVAAAAAKLIGDAPERIVQIDNCIAPHPWTAVLKRGAAQLGAVTDREAELPVIDVSDGWDAYLASRSRNFRSQVGRKTRALERDHDVAIERIDDPAGLDAGIGVFFDLHEARWRERGGSGSLTPSSRRFHADFARAALSRGWLRLYVMNVDGAPAAAFYGWRIGPRFSYYLAGLDPSRPDLSAGFVLLAKTIRDAAEEGASIYELLLGDESYKQRFATGSESVESVTIASRLSPAILGARGEQIARSVARRMSEPNRARARNLYARVTRRSGAGRRR